MVNLGVLSMSQFVRELNEMLEDTWILVYTCTNDNFYFPGGRFSFRLFILDVIDL